MAYDSTQFVQQAAIAAPERDFVRSERLGLLIGGGGVGALVGGFAAMALGQPSQTPSRSSLGRSPACSPRSTA